MNFYHFYFRSAWSFHFTLAGLNWAASNSIHVHMRASLMEIKATENMRNNVCRKEPVKSDWKSNFRSGGLWCYAASLTWSIFYHFQWIFLSLHLNRPSFFLAATAHCWLPAAVWSSYLGEILCKVSRPTRRLFEHFHISTMRNVSYQFSLKRKKNSRSRWTHHNFSDVWATVSEWKVKDFKYFFSNHQYCEAESCPP